MKGTCPILTETSRGSIKWGLLGNRAGAIYLRKSYKIAFPPDPQKRAIISYTPVYREGSPQDSQLFCTAGSCSASSGKMSLTDIKI